MLTTKLRVLFIPLEFRTWGNASHWAYPYNLGLEEGLDANGVEYVTIPAYSIHEASSSTWLYHAREICAGKKFDQVWFEISHSNLDETFLERLTEIAPIRIGFIVESLDIDPGEWINNPEGTRRRLKDVEKKLPYVTHLIAPDEVDVDKFNAHGPVPAMWFSGGIIPDRFICEQPPPASINCGVFYGALYGERKNWLEHSALKGLLVKPDASSEWATNLPKLFDELNFTADQFLKSRAPFDDNFFSTYMDSLRFIRRECFSLWLQALQRGCAIVNLPQFGKAYASRVVEGMAAGRPVITWEIPGRPRTKALFEDGKEILLYSRDNPEQLASHIQRILREPDLAQGIVTNARNKLRRFHTCERFVERILDWVKKEGAPLRKEPVNNKSVPLDEDDEIKLLKPHIGCGEKVGNSAKKPLVSILMPVSNSFSIYRSYGARLLPLALDSLLAQTYQDFELLILDNQSTDETPEVCKLYVSKDNRVRYILDHKQRFSEDGIEHLASFMKANIA
jgi:hypothetical protein